VNVFAKIFAQIFDSSISSDYMVRHIFMDLLVLADRDGVVDMTLDAISRRTNVPEELVAHAIAELMKPDRKSRSHEEQGCRLLAIDSHRDWGWQIVNYEHYRNIKDEEARRTYFRDKQRESRQSRRDASQTQSNAVKDNTIPSKEITQGEGNVEEDVLPPRETRPEDFDGTELSVANALLSELSIPPGQALLRVVAAALVFECKRLGSPERAIISLTSAMKAVQGTGVKWHLWFQDQLYIPIKEGSNVGSGKANASPAKQRIDGARRVLAEIAVREGLINPTRFNGGSDAPLPESGSGGKH
jgi:hypothetical protein